MPLYKTIYVAFYDAKLAHVLLEILQRAAQAFGTVHFGLPTKDFLGLGDIGPALHGVVFGQGLKRRLKLDAGEAGNFFAKLLDGNFIGVADVHGQGVVAEQEAVDAFYQVIYVAERAGLGPVAEHGQVLAA